MRQFFSRNNCLNGVILLRSSFIRYGFKYTYRLNWIAEIMILKWLLRITVQNIRDVWEQQITKQVSGF